MKKILIISSTAIALILAVASCKKSTSTDKVTVKVVAPHYATITLTGDQYYSINSGGTAPSIAATAYDSTTNEVCTVVQSAAGLDNTTPGLYPINLKTRNSDGYVSDINAFVAVTDIPAAMDISGNYQRTAGAMGIAEVTKIKNGLYHSSNIFGATAAASIAGFYFVHVNDSTIIIPSQQTDFGTFSPFNVSFSMVPAGDTFYTYSVNGALTSNAAIRKFIKQP
jgi:hypothetical protein